MCLRLASANSPLHIGGVALFTLPRNASPEFLHKLTSKLANLPQLAPVFGKKLNQADGGIQGWVEASDYDPSYHVFHYGVPAPGREADLLSLICRSHERELDYNRPLWELHLVEGLAGNRFAIYFKFHQALLEGGEAIQLIHSLFGKTARSTLSNTREEEAAERQRRSSLISRICAVTDSLWEQGKALPELSSLLGAMGRGLLDGDQVLKSGKIPQSPFNQIVSCERSIEILDLPLNKLRAIGEIAGGTVNDALLAVCGGGLRSYLLEQASLPEQSLLAGIPVILNGETGRQLNTLVCDLGTAEENPLLRLQGIVETSRQLKQEQKSGKTKHDYMNLVLLPALLMTLLGLGTKVPVPFNIVVSNAPGSRRRLFLEGARLEALYPLSLVTDGQALNITAVSYMSKMCIGITACPTVLPHIMNFSVHLKAAYRDLSRL